MKKALVTGGGGFLGLAIVRQLLQRGVEVRSFSRGHYTSLEELNVEQIQGDLANYQDVEKAAQGCDFIFHCAALAASWGKTEDFHRTNVTGTANVVRACRETGIQKLIHTSSPSATFSGEDEEGVDESHPYPDTYYADYPETKALAERIALQANGESLAVTALRPHVIWGPGDNNPIFNLIVRKARAGKLKIIGDGNNLIDTIYVDDAARAHLLAADCLDIDSKTAGKAYYLSQGDPRPFREVLNQLLAAAELPPVTSRIHPTLAFGLGWLLEKLYRTFRIEKEPAITRFQALTFSRAHWYDIGAAERDLGYRPRITIEQGMEELRKSLEHRMVSSV